MQAQVKAELSRGSDEASRIALRRLERAVAVAIAVDAFACEHRLLELARLGRLPPAPPLECSPLPSPPFGFFALFKSVRAGRRATAR